MNWVLSDVGKESPCHKWKFSVKVVITTLIVGRCRFVTDRINQNPTICVAKYRKTYFGKTSAILYNWKTADGIETGVSLINRATRPENTPDWHHACNYHRVFDIQLQSTSVRPILKMGFPCIFLLFSNGLNEAFQSLNSSKKQLFQYILLISSREISSL